MRRVKAPGMRIWCACQEAKMSYAARRPKRAVNMTLSEDVVREARKLTP